MKKPLLHHFVELEQIEECVKLAKGIAKIQVEAEVSHKKKTFPIYSFIFGRADRRAPTLTLIGGVHGLEKIGSHIVISYLKTIIELARWDKSFRYLLEEFRLLFYPLVNPAGMYHGTRSNPQGVDLMRNAPIEAEGPLPLWGGHRISAKIPWFRGEMNHPMEPESKALCNFVKRELWPSKMAVVLDVHSGFGMLDRLWFPYARSRKLFLHAAEVYALKLLLDRTYPNHIYKIEPQSKNYTAAGDLWDFMFEEHRKETPNNFFLPLSLELGSWTWVRKNPWQIFTTFGAFNPILPHRLSRAQRRHIVLMEFLIKAVISHDPWVNLSRHDNLKYRHQARKIWYPHLKPDSPSSYDLENETA